MSYTDVQSATVQDWLSTHWNGTAKCPAGHAGSWSVEENMAFVPGYVLGENGPKIAHERGFSFVVLTCSECGYVAFLDTRTVGLV